MLDELTSARYRMATTPGWMCTGTSRRRYVTATYRDVLNALGAPAARPLDRDKTHHEWRRHTPHGPATVYDYYCPTRPCSRPDEPVEWHLGAHNDLAAHWIAERITGESTDPALEAERTLHACARAFKALLTHDAYRLAKPALDYLAGHLPDEPPNLIPAARRAETSTAESSAVG